LLPQISLYHLDLSRSTRFFIFFDGELRVDRIVFFHLGSWYTPFFFDCARNWATLGVIHSFLIFFRRIAASSNKALHLTAIPLRSIAAGELSRYEARGSKDDKGRKH